MQPAPPDGPGKLFPGFSGRQADTLLSRDKTFVSPPPIESVLHFRVTLFSKVRRTGGTPIRDCQHEL